MCSNEKLCDNLTHLAMGGIGVLNFGKNALTGKLPNLSNLSNLEELHLFQNALTGSLPASLGLMSSLRKFSLCFYR